MAKKGNIFSGRAGSGEPYTYEQANKLKRQRIEAARKIDAQKRKERLQKRKDFLSSGRDILKSGTDQQKYETLKELFDLLTKKQEEELKNMRYSYDDFPEIFDIITNDLHKEYITRADWDAAIAIMKAQNNGGF